MSCRPRLLLLPFPVNQLQHRGIFIKPLPWAKPCVGTGVQGLEAYGAQVSECRKQTSGDLGQVDSFFFFSFLSSSGSHTWPSLCCYSLPKRSVSSLGGSIRKFILLHPHIYTHTYASECLTYSVHLEPSQALGRAGTNQPQTPFTP